MKFFGFCALLSISFASVIAQTVAVDSNVMTSVRNVNPDPNGEPWLVGGMIVTPEVLKKMESIPQWPGPHGLDKTTATATLPDHVYNYLNTEFPPTFGQAGNCCSAASGIGYCYTYEANVVKGTSATSANNQCAYGFIYDFLNGGNNQGIWYYDAWDIAKKTGCLSKVDFGGVLEDDSKGLNQTKWGNGYEGYHNAYAACRDSSYYIVKVGTSAGLTKLKQWMFDHGRGDKKGGVAVFSWFGSHTFSKIPTGMPDAGKKIITSVSGQEVTEHAMTFAGYDDRIGPSGSQLGALLLQNSWGTSYGDQGHCWVPYKYLSSSDGIWNSQVYIIEVRPHTVKLDYKVMITHNQRNKIQIKTGIANSLTAASAASSSLVGGATSLGAFNYSGGAYPMEGNGGSSTIEIGIDATDFFNAMTGNQATFFLMVTSKGGTGSIDSFSLMDYSSGSQAKEIPCSKKNVAITTGTLTLSIPYTKPTTAVKTLLTEQRASSTIKARGKSIFVPFNGKSTVIISNMQGRTLKTFQMDQAGWISLRKMAPKGNYVVTIKNRAKAATLSFFPPRASYIPTSIAKK
jgi:hypothetical protein